MSASRSLSSTGIDSTDILIRVAADASQTAASQYDDYYRSFVGLDGKAQSAGTVAGVLIGALVAFLNATRWNDLLRQDHSGYLKCILSIAALGALTTVILSVIAMRVRSALTPFAADAQITEAEDLAGLPPNDISGERVLRYYRGRLRHAKEALQNIAGHVEGKGRWVLATQISLVVTLAIMSELIWKII